ncbi:hypothetical protein QQ045_025557 [Rhodiola kirilowii]
MDNPSGEEIESTTIDRIDDQSTLRQRNQTLSTVIDVLHPGRANVSKVSINKIYFRYLIFREVMTSLIDSIRGCGLSGARIDKEELKKKLLLPFSLRKAMLLLERDGSVIMAKDPAAGAGRVSDPFEGDAAGEKAPEAGPYL